MSVKVPFAIRQAAAKFRRQRADYYTYIADKLDGGKGDIKLLGIFEKDADRYGSTARAKLSAYWAEEYSTNGANLSAAWRGTLPDDEVAIIDVAQDAGAGALLAALRDVARIARLSDQVRNESVGTLAAAAVGLTIALVMLTVFPWFSAHKLQDIYSFIPLDQWGPKGTFFNAWAANVQSYGLYGVLLLICVIVTLHWTLNNLTGGLRDWLDEHVALYRVVRDVKGALFLATMATLTRKRGNTMFTLSESLSTFARSVRSPWLRWRVEQIAEGVDATGAVGTEAFRTNLLSMEMYYFLQDMQEARGFSEGFEETGRYVEKTMLARILKRMAVYRWVMLISAVCCVVGVMATQFGVIYEMKGVMSAYYSTK
ncbi:MULTISPECIES: hypothetical protein [unclassified Variovorax]|uniref:hypothetical protein n=1 Tax=unclassified Variovorax TaxID=663243 RepID=UPI00076C226A|nr:MULTISPECIES: hypothetical protein [unclassified Variovorax]KWT65011.1 putative general secretion pathway protein [Variovorax sp. WDL1]PNG49121.1 Toxin coregulated pilus biosynthesis protein E [Variovorax sp. B2]PNG49506.1 Toxin coregulated pilus biosynthesis protein E [Variovorax sp. B4]VTV18861.1 TCP pilus biosynthesis protein TcpE [Variovorax sp. WDL1]